MDTERSNEAAVTASAVDALLSAISKSADDLRAFHDVVSKARTQTPPPFPRAAVVTIERIIGHLRKSEEEMQELLVALGLARS